jgi:hypothetical protein
MIVKKISMNSMRMSIIVIGIYFFVYLGCYAKRGERINIQHGQHNGIPFNVLGTVNNDTIFVLHDVDLGGHICELPNNTILMTKGGIIKNGTLVGRNTKISCKGKVFDRVIIKGTWNVPKISTSLFVNLSDDNALKNVMALTNKSVKNVVTIEKGNYWVAAHKEGDKCLFVNSNTTMIINGTIRLRANDYIHYNMLYVSGENISIKGKGTIIGDKPDHYGDKGEWGMGINVFQARYVSIKDLTVKDCWGDCIYVGGNSQHVKIEKCHLDNGRRQGISVTKADDVNISHCKISNVRGTKPEYAIDLEPNKGDTVRNVLIEHVEVDNCVGGFLATTGYKDSTKFVGNVYIRHCQLNVQEREPIRLRRCASVEIENCTINTSNAKPAVFSQDVSTLKVNNNNINIRKSVLSTVKNVVKDALGEGEYKPIKIVRSKKKLINNNKISEE